MPRKRNARIEAQDREANLDLDLALKTLMPYLPGMIETLGLAAMPKEGKDGKSKEPGDIRAAIAGIELVVKNLGTQTGDRAAQALAIVKRIREEALAEANSD